MTAARKHLTPDSLDGMLFATVSEVVAILRHDPRTIRRAIADGQIPAVKAGATWRIPVAWLAGQATGKDAGGESHDR